MRGPIGLTWRAAVRHPARCLDWSKPCIDQGIELRRELLSRDRALGLQGEDELPELAKVGIDRVAGQRGIDSGELARRFRALRGLLAESH
jgi:hypothetical protein